MIQQIADKIKQKTLEEVALIAEQEGYSNTPEDELKNSDVYRELLQVNLEQFLYEFGNKLKEAF
jgi:hypothetical protein